MGRRAHVRPVLRADRDGPFVLEVELWFQPIAYRWAHNLSEYDAMETRRFVRYYEDMAAGSAIPVTEVTTVVR